MKTVAAAFKKFSNERMPAKRGTLCLLCIIIVCFLAGCSGGFYEDNENAKEFLNPLFHPEKVDTDTTKIKSPG